MTLLITQVLTTLLTGIVSIIALNKDLRSKTKKLQTEATLIKRIVYFITIVSLGNSILSYYNSKADNAQLVLDKIELNKNLTALRRDNQSLRSQLTNKYLEQSNRIITSQEQSAKKLEYAAVGLNDLIKGSTEVPLFRFRTQNDSTLIGAFYRTDNKPLYNVSYGMVNFDNFLKCPIYSQNPRKPIKTSCITENSYYSALIPVIDNVLIDNIVPLPKYNRKASRAKYLLTFTLKSKIYKEEAIYQIDKSTHETYQAVRIIEMKNDKITKVWIPKIKDTNLLKNVNWDKEFPVTYIHAFFLLDF